MSPSPEEARMRIAAIGDLHVQESHVQPYRALFVEMSAVADVLLLCGDLTNYGKLTEAEILADDLKAVDTPIVAVLGNHDHECGAAEAIRDKLTHAGAHVLDDGKAVEIQGVGFAGCMGSMGGFGRSMLSAFGEQSVKTFVQACLDETMKLETGLRMLRTPRAVAVLHYAPIAATLEGEPKEIYPFLGNSRLAETIDRFDNVRAVAHGHAHRGVYRGATPKGVPVYNCARTVVTSACEQPFALFDV